MKINIKSKTDAIDHLLSEQPSKAAQSALRQIRGIVENAKLSAFTYPPMACFTYVGSLSSELVEELSQHQVEMLAQVDIQFTQNTSMRTHKVSLKFTS